MLSGALEGKVRNIVASQVAANPIPSPSNERKVKFRLDKLGRAIGIDGINADTSEDAPFCSRMLNGFARMVVNYGVIAHSERCQSPVCHR